MTTEQQQSRDKIQTHTLAAPSVQQHGVGLDHPIASDGLTAFATVWLAFVTSALAYYTARLWRSTREMAREAKAEADAQGKHTLESLSLTRQSLEVGIAKERARVVVLGIAPYNAGRTWVFQIRLGNIGSTAAEIIGHRLAFSLWVNPPDSAPEVAHFEACSSPLPLPPAAAPRNILAADVPTVEQEDAARRGQSNLWAHGCIEYIDFMRRRRQSGFCFRFEPEPERAGQPLRSSHSGWWSVAYVDAFLYDRPAPASAAPIAGPSLVPAPQE